MNSAHTPDQTEQNQDQELRPDFSHRLAVTNLSNTDGLTDSIMLMADRLSSLLLLLSVSVSDGVKISDDSMANVIDMALYETEDIKSLVRAFNKAKSAKRKTQKNPEL